MPFGPREEVLVKAIEDMNWEVREPIDYTGQRDSFEVPFEQHTDFASVPRVFVWFLPRYGRYTKAAILHDYLWRERAAKGTLRWVDADAIFRRAMRELGVPFLRRWILWSAVRYGALVKPGGWDGWWKESWRVLLVTLLALPIVLPPALVILVALILWYFVELLFYIPLRISKFAKERLLGQTETKRVNMPAFRLKT